MGEKKSEQIKDSREGRKKKELSNWYSATRGNGVPCTKKKKS